MMKTDTAIAVSSLYAWHQGRGARFAEIDGWRLPIVYSSVAEETQAARTGLALGDISSLSKLSVRDTALVAALAGSCSPGQVVAFGESPAGWACCLAPDHGLLLSAAGHNALQGRLQSLPAYKPEVVFDITSSYAGFALFGPEHQKVMRGLTAFDVECIAVPGSCAETGLAGVHAILVRPPGVLAAIQIYVAWDVGEFVCDRILEAAGTSTVVPLGSEALQALWCL